MKKVFNYYADPGHGWVKVPFSLIKRLKIEKEISDFSYWRNGFVYLEEDCDMTKLLEAHPERENMKFNIFHNNKDSKIRNYECYDKRRA